MNIEKLKTHKKFVNDYFLYENEVYTKEELIEFFNIDENTLNTLTVENNQKIIKPYRYKGKRFLLKKIIESRNNLFSNLKLEKAKNSFENLKIAQPLMKYFVENLSYNSLITKNRLYSLKNKKYELNENQKSIEKAYKKEVYNTEKAYKKTKSLLKQIEKQTELQNTIILYETLVNNKTSNGNDNYTLMYLLNKLNIDAYSFTLKNSQLNKIYTLLLIPNKKNNYDTVKYYTIDITKCRRETKYNLTEKKLELFGKNKLQKEFEQYEYVKLENLQKVILPGTSEWNKTIKQIATDTIEFNL